ncbi:MAG: GNAT family N-acetyltransferase [Spirochaetes bacterium]|nr:GNAT family N-acetyltransferase [Spirochaetota bacterium]
MTKTLIRKLNINDGKAVKNIIKSIAYRTSNLDYEKITEEESKRADNGSFVAEVNGEVIGFVISYILYGVFGIEKSAWLAMIGIDPKYMDRGIGKKLADEIFKFYHEKGIVNIFTSVRWDSTDMLSYFKALGFDRSSYINLTKTIE